MKIRMLDEDDAIAWWQLRLHALEMEPFAFGQAAEEHRHITIETIKSRFHNSSVDNFTLGVFDGDALVGMATFVRESGSKEKHKGHIYGVFVSATHRSHGLGRALIASLLEKVRSNTSLEQILLAVATCQEPARKLYRCFGFETYGTEPNALKIAGKYIDEDHMILKIR